MPRIRKQTSNRKSTNERKKLQHKVRESRKKKGKAAKKSVQWKFKHKKDPGIPSTFPYKDQILAEIADQRRLAAEEKQRKKDEKKLKKKAAKDGVDDEEMSQTGSDNEGENADGGFLDEVKALGLDQGFDGIASLSAKRLDAKLKAREVPMQIDVEEREDEDVQVVINGELPNLQAALDAADVVIEVLDARDPLSFRSAHLEELVDAKPGRRVLLVLNKIDTCPRESVASWTAHLRAHHPTFPFRAASCFLPAGPEPSTKEKGKAKAKAPRDDALGSDAVLQLLGEWAEQKKGDDPLCVAVVGITNVGKSSFINSLLRKSALSIYTLATSSRGPTTTTCAQEVTFETKGKLIRLVDTPGISWETNTATEVAEPENVEDIRARDILMRRKGRIDRLKDPLFAVKHIVSRANTEDLMLLYSLPAFSVGDTDSFLSCVARAHQLVKKKGELDLSGAARIVLRDWTTGKFPWYTIPPAGAAETVSSADDAVLDTLRTRKELRKAHGLVKLRCGAVETRKVQVDEPWAPAERDDDADSNDEDEERYDEDGGREDEEEADEEMTEEMTEETEEEEEEEEEPTILSGKQKRKRATEKAPIPRKKVSFGPDPTASKQAPSAAARKAAMKEKKPVKTAPKKIANNTKAVSQKAA
ncbi:hypothetical protein GGX14DRAFT_416477, partial [Mycena pura]